MQTDRKGREISHASVPLSRIDWDDERFRIRNFHRCDELDRSLDRCGLLFPPSLWAKSERTFVIVDGFKRLDWFKARGVDEVECCVLPGSWDFVRLVLYRVEGKLFGPPLNVVEIAQIVSLMEDCPPGESLEYFSALGISPRPEIVAKWRVLAGADSELLEAVATGLVCERAAFSLIEWGDDTSRVAVLGILKELRCSASIQVELLERITEVSIMGGMTRAKLLSSLALHHIISDPNLNHRQKTQALRTLLGRLRYPRLTAREEAFKRCLSQLEVPKAVSLLPPPAFEGSRWQLQIDFSNPQELKNLIGKVLSLLESSRFETLMFPSKYE